MGESFTHYFSILVYLLTVCVGVLYLYTGSSLMMSFDSEKPAIKQQIQAEFDKYANQKPPAAIKGNINKNKDNDHEKEDRYIFIVFIRPNFIN